MIERVLIVGPSWVGDMVMAQGLFRLLREQRSNLIIDVLAPEWSLPLIARMPEVTDAIIMPAGHGELKLKLRYQLAKQLRAKNYTQAIVLPNSFKSALIPFLAKIPKRTGYRGEMRYFLLNDLRYLAEKKHPLMIDRFLALGLPNNLDLPEKKYFPKLIISETEREQTIKKFQLSIQNKVILALCPGAEFGAAKRWPEKHYAEVAKQYVQSGGQVWLFGSANDREVANKIIELADVDCINLAGKTKLAEAIDLLSLAKVVVTNDSGLMHIAAALDKPLVAVYGPTSPGFTPPLQIAAKILQLSLPCQPCFQRICPLKHHDCMEKLLPEKVITALKEISV